MGAKSVSPAYHGQSMATFVVFSFSRHGFVVATIFSKLSLKKLHKNVGLEILFFEISDFDVEFLIPEPFVSNSR